MSSQQLSTAWSVDVLAGYLGCACRISWMCLQDILVCCKIGWRQTFDFGHVFLTDEDGVS